jgi:hypothetical protein
LLHTSQEVPFEDVDPGLYGLDREAA